jgi:hypothetical protein
MRLRSDAHHSPLVRVRLSLRHSMTSSAAGDAVSKQIFSESPVPVVRAVWPDGIIRTFTEQVVTDEHEFENQEAETEEE